MYRPTRAIIDSAAFVDNYRLAKSLAANSRAVAIIKANGYGHGAVALAHALHNEADAFGVACIEEALELRESGIHTPIVLLEGIFSPSELPLVFTHGFSLVVHNQAQLDWVVNASPANPMTVWLKLDTGMHRLGFDPCDFAEAHARLLACKHVENIVLMSHFARADETRDNATQTQLARFHRVCQDMRQPVSLANSAAILGWPATHGDWVRPGIMLYGASPLDTATPDNDGLKPVMQLESAIISVRDLDAGEAIGYGARYSCSQATRVGVVAIGYADGYPRHAADGTPVAVDGIRSRIIGRVSMDMLTLDLTHIPQAGPGSRVELWGQQISANEVAAHADTIAYQLFTGITRRVPRLYQTLKM